MYQGSNSYIFFTHTAKRTILGFQKKKKRIPPRIVSPGLNTICNLRQKLKRSDEKLKDSIDLFNCLLKHVAPKKKNVCQEMVNAYQNGEGNIRRIILWFNNISIELLLDSNNIWFKTVVTYYLRRVVGLYCTMSCPSRIIYDSRHNYRLLWVVCYICPQSNNIHDSSYQRLFVLAQIGERIKKVARWPNLQVVKNSTRPRSSTVS